MFICSLGCEVKCLRVRACIKYIPSRNLEISQGGDYRCVIYKAQVGCDLLSWQATRVNVYNNDIYLIYSMSTSKTLITLFGDRVIRNERSVRRSQQSQLTQEIRFTRVESKHTYIQFFGVVVIGLRFSKVYARLGYAPPPPKKE